MATHVRKLGDGAAVRIPAATLAAAGFKLGDAVEVREQNGRIVIEHAGREAVTLERLFEGITPENRHDEIDWGPPRGREFW